MKYNDPIINISMFEVENIVTESQPTPTAKPDAVDLAKEYINEKVPTGIKLVF